MGKFVYTVMLAMSEYFLDNIKAGWMAAKTRAVGRGVKIGPTPYGYRRGQDAVLKPDDETAEVVRETFRIAARQGFGPALAYVEEHGVRHRLTATTLRRLLRNRTYLGEARYGELLNEAAHSPLVSPSIWAAAQPEQEAQRRPRRTYPLSGLARCASCGSPLVGTRAGNGIRAYRCSAAARSKRQAPGEMCSAPAFASADPLEALVRRTLAARLNDQAYVGGDDPAGDLEASAQVLADARRELDDLLGDVGLRRVVGADRFRQLAENAVMDGEEHEAAYAEVARRAERRLRVPAVELLLGADL